MSIEVASIGSTNFKATDGRTARGPRPPAAREDVGLAPGEIPDSPPREVLDACDAAARAYRELHAQGRELRFALDPDGGNVHVEVRDLDGNVLRRIPPSEALDVATGGALD